MGPEVPRCEFAVAVDGVVGDAVQEHAEIGLRIPAVELRGTDQGVDDRCAPAAFRKRPPEAAA